MPDEPNNLSENMDNIESPIGDLDDLRQGQIETTNLLGQLEEEMFEAVHHENYQKAVCVCEKLIQLENTLKIDSDKIKKRKEQKEKFLERAEEKIDNNNNNKSHLREDGCGLGSKPPCGREKIDPVACTGCKENTSINPRNIGGNMPKKII